MIRTLALAASVAVAPISFAFADDYSWSGIYAGIHAGWGAGDVDWYDVHSGWFSFILSHAAHSAYGDGVLAGGQIGVLHHNASNIVGGIELSVSGLDGSTSVASPVYPTSDTWQTNVEFVATATARLGYSFGRFLPYVEAGYAGGNVRVTNVDHYACAPAVCAFDSKRWHNGYVVGAGADYRVTKNIVAGLNYRFMDLVDRAHTGATTVFAFGIPYQISESYTVSAQVHSATFRLSWLFNPD